MKKYADVSKVVYDPKGTDPFTFRWYDPDEVIAGKKMREHLKFALSYWHTIDAEGVDMFGSGTMDKSMGQTDPMAKFRAKADFAFELMEKLDIDYYCFHDVDIAPEGATLAESIANFRVMVDYLYELQKKTGKNRNNCNHDEELYKGEFDNPFLFHKIDPFIPFLLLHFFRLWLYYTMKQGFCQ